MRLILVDWARARRAVKRGGGYRHYYSRKPWQSPDGQRQISLRSMTLLDDALNGLAAVDPRKSQVVELRFFGGLSMQETAEVLNISEESVHRDWKLAKSWLRRELNKEAPRGS
jgi:RNA polymerase sigma factor (TIGR02999 family)